MEATVELNPGTKLYDLIVNGQTISTSKNYGHWQYHLNRGSLSKAIAKFNITSFVYVGFEPKPDEPKPEPVALPSWFGTSMSGNSGDRKRGRPRKYVPGMTGVAVHKISDEEPPFRILRPKDKIEIQQSFQTLVKIGKKNQEALEYVSKQFYIPYRQAYEAVEDVL